MQARARIALAGATVKVGRHAVDPLEEEGRQVVRIAGFDSTTVSEIAGTNENGVVVPGTHDTLAGPTYEEWTRSQLS
jgi:hypothetical protein